MRHIYRVANFVRPTTAAPSIQTAPASIRTMLQVASLSTQGLQVTGYGISWQGFTAVQPPVVEIFGTTVAATGMTALAAADVQCYTDENAPASDTLLQFGTGLTAFASGSITEGTVANYRLFDIQDLPPSQPYRYEQSLGNECMIDASQFVRIRVTAPATVPMYCWLDVARL